MTMGLNVPRFSTGFIPKNVAPTDMGSGQSIEFM